MNYDLIMKENTIQEYIENEKNSNLIKDEKSIEVYLFKLDSYCE